MTSYVCLWALGYVSSRKIEPLVKAAEGSTDRDLAWTPDGHTILMSSGTRVFAWTRGAAG